MGFIREARCWICGGTGFVRRFIGSSPWAPTIMFPCTNPNCPHRDAKKTK